MYIVKQRVYNDYRCCCFQSWDADVLKVESFKDAVAYCPIDYDFSGSLLSVEIYEEDDDGLTLIMVGALSWPPKKDERYKWSYWTTIDLSGSKTNRITYKNGKAVNDDV